MEKRKHNVKIHLKFMRWRLNHYHQYIRIGRKKKNQKSFTLCYIIQPLMIFSVLIGCTETPYSGPILSVNDVDRYLQDTGVDTICLQDGFDSVCIRLVGHKEDHETDSGSITVIHPTDITYQFHYEGDLILLVRRNIEDRISDNVGWLIQIYYPNTIQNASGLDIRIAEGFKPTINKNQSLEIGNVIEEEKMGGPRIGQFFVKTVAKEITIRVDGLVPDYIAIFYITTDGIGSDKDTNTFQLQPK
ncbi:hypothetical protein JT359_20700 [Candidatus Poribacteria bacterium]|nr:hypothetical protein [Candidatus Poribacteria bacterium]